MEILLAILVGGLYAAGVYMLLRRSLVKILIGLALLGHAANLLIFTSAGLTRGQPPVIAASETVLSAPYADPLPQALVLTAIVIGFGLTAFALALTYRVYKIVGTDDLDRMRGTISGEEES
ncbi:MAG: Na+/H+ antiporter subunit C [Chloroflexi bacterium]|nr:Na+/H+ antiporter subunit C [Chloroflexota bacterium]